MIDYTASVIRLEEAYSNMQIARRRVADEVKAAYRIRMREEIERRQEGIEMEFARLLKEESDRGLPGSVIRSEVLRTQDWSRWKKWRDMGDIAPDRVVYANEKELKRLADRVFRWEVCEDNEIGYAIVLMKDAEGKKLDEEVWFTYITEKEGVLSVWPDRENPVHVDLWNERWNKEPLKLKRFLSDLANENRKDIS